MEIIYLNSVDSTHKYLKEYIKTNSYTNPLAIVTSHQTDGIGSRDNKWQGKKGNLFFSFVLDKTYLPIDLPLQSSSIYFSFVLKQILNSYGSKVWLKWPNDFYIKNKKIGGTITNMAGEFLYCGIGLNLIETSKEYGYLDIDIDYKQVLKEYFELLETKILWKDIYQKYKDEFEQNHTFTTTLDGKKVSLKDSILNEDGSIKLNENILYSLR